MEENLWTSTGLQFLVRKVWNVLLLIFITLKLPSSKRNPKKAKSCLNETFPEMLFLQIAKNLRCLM